MREELQALFAPKTIAIYGASMEAGTLGNRAILNLQKGGFPGAIVPINPRNAGQALGGLDWYGCAKDYGETIDHAILLVRAGLVESALLDAIGAKVKSVSILSGGFAEMGAQGEEVQARIEAAAREAGVQLLGPNCLGFVNTQAQVYASPGSVFEVVWPEGGPLAIVSQSGAVAADLLARARAVDVEASLWISTGNESGVTIADAIEVACDSEPVRAIAVYMESIRNVDAFRAAAQRARQCGKLVAVIRPGRTAAGVSAVQSHTAALVTNDRLYDALFRELDVARVDSQRELIDVVRTFIRIGRPAGGLAVVSSSGGSGAMTTDAAAVHRLRMSRISPEGQARLRAIVPNCSPGNPIDITGAANQTPHLLDEFFDVILSEPDVRQMMMIHGASMMWRDRAEKITETLVRMAAKHKQKRVVFVGEVDADLSLRMADAGIAVFDDSVALVRAMAMLCLDRSFDAGPAEASHVHPASPPARLLDEDAALDFLEHDCGVPVVSRRIASDREDAVRAAAELDFPVVMKAVIPGVAHKTELGAVCVGVRDEAQVRDAWAKLEQVCRDQGVAARVLVEAMVGNVVSEMLVSAFVDPLLGPFVTVGAGGTLTELLDDVAVSTAPVSAETANQMLGSLRNWKRYERNRTGAAGNRDELVRAIVQVSRAIGQAAGGGSGAVVREIEINPFMLRPGGSCAVDAVVRLAS